MTREGESIGSSVPDGFRVTPMTSHDRLIKAKLGILALAQELQNVARACKLAGLSRSQFYVMKKAYETYGKEGLAPHIRRKPQMPNRTPVAMESQILLKTHANPAVSYVRLAERMKAEGIAVTPAMVRYVWGRHGLSIRSARLRWVKRRNGQVESTKVKDLPTTLADVHYPTGGDPRAASSPSPVTSSA